MYGPRDFGAVYILLKFGVTDMFQMTERCTRGAFAIVLNERREVLLVKRQDVPLWDLPGGRVEDDGGEDTRSCVIRETREETGLEVEITEYIGRYYNFECSDIQFVYACRPHGGEMISSGPETKKLAWFPLNRLPALMVPHRKRQLCDFYYGQNNVSVDICDGKIILALKNFLKLLKIRNKK